MSIREITMYQVVCDEPDCGTSTQDVSDDYFAWGDASTAEQYWYDDDQQVTGNSKHYCSKHRKPVCCGCDSTEVTTNDMPDNSGDWYCATCAPKERTS